MKCASLVVIFCVVVSLNICLCEDFPTVKISDGELKGSFLKSRNSRSYAAFLGIPFAKPPKRFKNAGFPEPWEGIRDATKSGNVCMQKNMFSPTDVTVAGSEDCLYLNVYSNKLDGRLPVIAYIHGGSFMAGSSDMFGANYVMDEDIVLVTMNYRLGALGFLNTGDGEVEGNLGLKDQNLALQWVQKNIYAFGGDPDQVTIMGLSAGSSSVHYQVLSPMSKGLFKYAILQSGSALNPWAYTDNPKPYALALGNSLGCNNESSKSLIECLSQETATDIISQQLTEWNTDPFCAFPPAVDVGSEKVFLPETPIELLTSGKFNKVPMIFTVCKDEGLLLHAAIVVRNEKLLKEINEEFPRVLPITLMYNKQGLSVSQKNWISSHIKKFYFGKKDIGLDTQQNLTNMYSDRSFIHGVAKSVALHSKHSKVYNGIISHHGEISILSFFGIQEYLGVGHGDDMMYVSSPTIDIFPKIKPGSPDEKFSKQMVKWFTTFAATGNPGSISEDLAWEPLNASSEKLPSTWLDIDLTPRIIQDPFKERLEFWDKLFDKVKTFSFKVREEL